MLCKSIQASYTVASIVSWNAYWLHDIFFPSLLLNDYNLVQHFKCWFQDWLAWQFLTFSPSRTCWAGSWCHSRKLRSWWSAWNARVSTSTMCRTRTKLPSKSWDHFIHSFTQLSELVQFTLNLYQGSHGHGKGLVMEKSWKIIGYGKVMEFSRSWKKSWKTQILTNLFCRFCRTSCCCVFC